MPPSNATPCLTANCSPCCNSLARTSAFVSATKSRKARRFSKRRFAGRSSRCTTTPSSATRKTARRSSRRKLKNRSTSAPTNMPTPSEPKRRSEFGIGHSPPRRSIFGNYKPGNTSVPLTPALSPGAPGEREKQAMREESFDGRRASPALETVHPLPGSPEEEGRGEGDRFTINDAPLQSSIDTALARAFAYRFLAQAFEDPEPDGW